MKNPTIYSLFQSELRGSNEIDRKLENALNEMQTPENLMKLKKAVSLGDWEPRKVKRVNLDFSKFETKLNHVRESCFKTDNEIYKRAL